VRAFAMLKNPGDDACKDIRKGLLGSRQTNIGEKKKKEWKQEWKQERKEQNQVQVSLLQ
jgi:hypothetical protein